MCLLILFLPPQGFLPGPVLRHVARGPALNKIKPAILTGKRLTLFHVAQETQR
jgi:hypothetical protein